MSSDNGNEEAFEAIESLEDDDQREPGVTIDLDRLERQARELFLHRFVDHVKKARGEYGRYLTLRPGDQLAIRAADDGSEEFLDDVIVEDGLVDPLE